MDKKAIMKEFTDKLDEHTRKAACGRDFILVDRLQHWLRSPVGEEGTYADRLALRVAYRSRNIPGLPMALNKFKPGEDCCLLVFCILLRLGRGNLIHEFLRGGGVDKLIPLSESKLLELTRDLNLVTEFQQLQHRFCPARFGLHDRRKWGEDIVIPIYQKRPINIVGTAKIWRIDVPDDLISQALRDISSSSRINYGSAEKPDWCYVFTLKTFLAIDHSLYDNEMNAYFGLKECDGIVRWLADFEKADKSTSAPVKTVQDAEQKPVIKTYNILLAFGTKDLQIYFKDNLPPLLPDEIEKFWIFLFAVADAVKGIHILKDPNPWQEAEYFGWHADIRPDNIFDVEKGLNKTDPAESENGSTSEYKEKGFKLAAPGFAKFVKKTQEDPEDVPKQIILGGTETYGAPEYPGYSVEAVSQAIDLWSLGCVFSVAATWIILGQWGVDMFHNVRLKATKRLVEAQRTQEGSNDSGARTTVGHHFHDGHEVLAAVTDWHRFLRTVIRKTDIITSKVLDLVDHEMLLGPPESRINASQLCDRLSRLMKSLPRKRNHEMPDTILALLGEIDEEAALQAANARDSRSEALSNTSAKTVTPTFRHSLAEHPLNDHPSSIDLA